MRAALRSQASRGKAETDSAAVRLPSEAFEDGYDHLNTVGLICFTVTVKLEPVGECSRRNMRRAPEE